MHTACQDTEQSFIKDVFLNNFFFPEIIVMALTYLSFKHSREKCSNWK